MTTQTTPNVLTMPRPKLRRPKKTPKSKHYQLQINNYKQQQMFCPAQGKQMLCIGIPLDEFESTATNPARLNGTQESNVEGLYNDLTTHPQGQLEPGCVRFNKVTGKFTKVFGYNRFNSVRRAWEHGIGINNSPDHVFWCYIFTGTQAQEKWLQAKENGNKRTQSEATPQDIANLIIGLKDLGEFDKPGSRWVDATEEEQKKRIQDRVAIELPKWAARKFRGIWSIIRRDPTIATKFTTYDKTQISDYFLGGNPYGITVKDALKQLDRAIIKTGDVIKKNGIRYGFYLVSRDSEITAGATPGHVLKHVQQGKSDRIILICVDNHGTVKTIASKRQAIITAAGYWNNIFSIPALGKKAFREALFISQTDTEIAKHNLKHEYVHHEKF